MIKCTADSDLPSVDSGSVWVNPNWTTVKTAPQRRPERTGNQRRTGNAHTARDRRDPGLPRENGSDKRAQGSWGPTVLARSTTARPEKQSGQRAGSQPRFTPVILA